MYNTSRTDRRNNDFDTLDQTSPNNNNDVTDKKHIIITYNTLDKFVLICINLLYVAYFSYYGYKHLSNEWSKTNLYSFVLYVGVVFIPNLICTILILYKKHIKCICKFILLNGVFTVVTMVLTLAYYCDQSSTTKVMNDNYFQPYILIGCLIYELCMFIVYIKIYNKINVVTNTELLHSLTSPRSVQKNNSLITLV